MPVKSRKKTILKWVLISAAVVLAIAVGVGIWVYRCAYMEYDSATSTTLIIKQGASKSEIEKELVEQLGEYGATIYRVWTWRGGEEGKAPGVYVIKKGDKVWSVASRMIAGRSSTVDVTFNNVRILTDLADKISKNFIWESEDFIDACENILPAKGFAPDEFPAAFLPDPYQFYASATPAEVIERLLEYRNAFWNSERRGKAELLGLTPVEVTTLASIVEEESNNRIEQPDIARLYLNRLGKGMKLQADPTVKFALGDFSIRRLSKTQTEIASPFNTYYVKGLPPGPIRIPDGTTIDIVLDCPVNDYLYMCAKPDGSGTHNFASNYSDHLQNAAEYHKWLDSRNINL